jgi:SSS family solute:Na+ symporter
MTSIDLFIVVTYVAGLFTFGMWVGLRETTEDYLIVSRRASFTLVLFSIVSTWVGVGTTVATAASAYEKGISLGITGAAGGLVGVLVAGLVAPRIKAFGDKYQAHTIGDFVGLRFGAPSKYLASGLIVIVYLLLCAAQFIGLMGLLTVWGNVALKWAVIGAGVATVIYTAFAGIKSDFYTDGVHFVVLTTVLFLVMLPITWKAGGGAPALRTLPKSTWNPFAYGGVGFFIAGLLFGVAGVFVTMEIWQRIFASTSAKTARMALISSGVMIVTFYTLSTFLGLFARLIVPNLANRDHALFELMQHILPRGILGLGLAAFFGIFISTANSMIMVGAASLTKDVYLSRLRPSASEHELLWAARAITFVVGGVGLTLAVWIHDLVALAVNSLFVLLVLLPSVLGGFFWRRSTSKAAFWSMASGALVVALLTPRYPNEAFAPGFFVSAVVFIVLTLLTKHDPSETLEISSPIGGSK